MVNPRNCLRNEGAFSSGVPEPKDPIPPPTGQQVELLVQGVGQVGQDGGALSDQVSVVQSGETELGHPCDLGAGVNHPLQLYFTSHFKIPKPAIQDNS